MALASSLQWAFLLPGVSNLFPSSAVCHQKGFKRTNYWNVFCRKNGQEEKSQSINDRSQAQSGATRRGVLFMTASTALSLSPSIVSVAFASNDLLEDFRTYSDDVNKFMIMIPQDWKVGAGETNGVNLVTAFFPEEASSSNVSIVISGLGADFTRLESFGKVNAFAESLVNGLDRSWQRPPGVAAKLIDCKAANGLYYIKYTLQNPSESRRHLFSVLGMANNGWYNRLYTVTGQFVEEETEKYGSKIEKAIASFRFI